MWWACIFLLQSKFLQLGRLKLDQAFSLRCMREHCACSVLKRVSKRLEFVRPCCLLLLHPTEAGFPFELLNLVLCLLLVCFAVSLLVLEPKLEISLLLICFAVSLLILQSHNNIRLHTLDLLLPFALLHLLL